MDNVKHELDQAETENLALNNKYVENFNLLKVADENIIQLGSEIVVLTSSHSDEVTTMRNEINLLKSDMETSSKTSAEHRYFI